MNSPHLYCLVLPVRGLRRETAASGQKVRVRRAILVLLRSSHQLAAAESGDSHGSPLENGYKKTTPIPAYAILRGYFRTDSYPSERGEKLSPL